MIIDVDRGSISVFNETNRTLKIFKGDLQISTANMISYFGNTLKDCVVDVNGYGGCVYDILERLDLSPHILRVERIK